MAPRLKVFEWSDGFHRFTVAASSRPKALSAWGIQQDIFASGLAREITAGDDVAAALASPGQVIERGLSVDIGEASARPKVSAKKGPTPAQQRKLDDLNTELEDLDRKQADLLRSIETELQQLTERRNAEVRSYDLARQRLTKALKTARAK